MINKILHFSVYHRGLVILGAFLLGILGWFSFLGLPIDAVPDISNVQVQINSTVSGLGPEELERTVTFPMETAMSGLAGVTQVRSITRFGLSQVTVVFEDDVDIYRARQMVSERLQMVGSQLPKNVDAKLGPVSSGLGEIYHYSVEAETVATGEERIKQLMELRALQDWYIKPRLLNVKGVADVNTIGGYEKQFFIQPRPGALSKYGIHFADLETALNLTNQNVGGGYVQQSAEQYLVQGVGLFKSIEDIKNVPVKYLETYKTITIGDIADVDLGKELRTGAALVHGKEAVLGTIMMLLGENSRTVATRVNDRIHEIQAALPKGYKIAPLYNRSELVNATLGTVEHNLVMGAGLVILVLLVLVGNLRAAIVTALTIPFSLLLTFIGMKKFGISGNLMSLGALDFGIIIDGAVIVVDNCVRHLHERHTKLGRNLTSSELKQAIYEASVEIRTAAGFGEMIIVVVFLPIFALIGIEGKMFIPMAATFSIAVISALVLSFTMTPALASILLAGKISEREPWVMGKIRDFYLKALSKAIQYKRATIGVGIASVVLGGIAFSLLGGEFLPQLDEKSLAIQLIRPVNISLDKSIALQEKTDRILGELPEVSHVFSRIGTAEIASDPMGVNLADCFVMLKPESEWPKINGRVQTKRDFLAKLERRLESELAGQSFIFSQPIQMRFNELLEGTRADVTAKIFGEDMAELTSLSEKVARIVEKVPGAGDVEFDLKGTSPILRVIPKENILRTLGVSNREVLETVSTAMGGEEAGKMFEGVRRFPIVVRLKDREREDLETIRNLPVGISSNSTIPLSQAADVKFDETYSLISREQTKRRAAVMINPRGRDTESFVREAKASVDQQIKLPSGYFMEWGGNFKNLSEAKSRLMILAPLAMVFVLMMIYAAFQSAFQTALIFFCVPLALVGGVLGLVLNGLPFSISAGVGFIALSGIAVLNGIVLVHYFNDLRVEGLKGEALIKKGTSIRLRPVLMTALVDIFGFLPMMLSSGVGAEVQRPLASVVIGGVISSTLLTLIVLPALYLVFEKWMGIKHNEANSK